MITKKKIIVSYIAIAIVFLSAMSSLQSVSAAAGVKVGDVFVWKDDEQGTTFYFKEKVTAIDASQVTVDRDEFLIKNNKLTQTAGVKSTFIFDLSLIPAWDLLGWKNETKTYAGKECNTVTGNISVNGVNTQYVVDRARGIFLELKTPDITMVLVSFEDQDLKKIYGKAIPAYPLEILGILSITVIFILYKKMKKE